MVSFQGAHLLKMSCSIAVGKPDQENNVITATTRKIIRGLLEAPTPDIEQLGEKLFSIENNEVLQIDNSLNNMVSLATADGVMCAQY